MLQLPLVSRGSEEGVQLQKDRVSVQCPRPAKGCESNDAQPFMSSSSSLLPAKSDSTCGSTVFSPGHPRQYSLAPAMLNFADRTRRGVFIAVWPQITGECLKLQLVPLRLLCYLLSWLNRSLKNPELLVVRPVSSWRTRAMTANSAEDVVSMTVTGAAQCAAFFCSVVHSTCLCSSTNL